MNDISLYFTTGVEHILSWDSKDHILFIVALASIYLFQNLKNVLVLVTAFTIGHSITLALSVYDIFRINDNWVELLIPVTIIFTAIFNLLQKDFNPKSLRLNYFFALFFGLIHGMGFANTIRFMLAKGEHIALPLVSFNIGLEAAQIIVVAIILSFNYLMVNYLLIKRINWVKLLNCIVLIWAFILLIQQISFKH
jgi:hypothetical protein